MSQKPPVTKPETHRNTTELGYTPIETGKEVLRQLKENYEYDHLYAAVSGGDDSMTAAHFAYHAEEIDLDGVIHCDTGIGVPAVREFVEDWCDEHDLELLVAGNENARFLNERFEHLVRQNGFPGSAPEVHSIMWENLKSKPLGRLRSFIEGEDEQIALISGVRRHESKTRWQELGDDPIQKNNSIIWASPLVNFTDQHLKDYRRDFNDIEQSTVAGLLCISGECLCGAFGNRRKTLPKLSVHYPEVAQHIFELEYECVDKAARGEIEREHALWAHGSAEKGAYDTENVSEQSGLMCSDCEDSCSKEYELGEMETEYQSPAESFLINNNLSSYWNWPFYCVPCSKMIDDPYTHRQEVHPFDAEQKTDGLPGAWDMRMVCLGASQEAEELITEPNGWNINPSQLTRDKAKADRCKNIYYYEDYSLSYCDGHAHKWEPYNGGPVDECTECHCFRLSDYDPENPGDPAIPDRTTGGSAEVRSKKDERTRKAHKAIDEFAKNGTVESLNRTASPQSNGQDSQRQITQFLSHRR